MKRILSYDGGGIRGIFSLQIAAMVERHLREALGRPDLVLADVVDFFAGTSTGAIIAASLAWGAPVAEVEAMYLTHGADMFDRSRGWHRLQSTYRGDGLAAMFRSYFREDDGSPALLGSAKLRPTLLIVMRNATTGSPWPVTNNPNGRFNDPALDDCNLRLPLWQLLRASTAAPVYFPAEEIGIGAQQFLFVDGGITPFNNPALLSVLMATLPCYKLEWSTGRDMLHVISIGTGSHRPRMERERDRIFLWDSLKFVAPALIGSASDNQDQLCRVLGHCLHGAPIDSEMGALDAPSLFAPGEQKFSYVRYNAALDSGEFGPPMTGAELKLDNLAMISRLTEIGRQYADAVVKPSHLWPAGSPAAS